MLKTIQRSGPVAHENGLRCTGGDKPRPYISMCSAREYMDVGEGFMPSRNQLK